MAFIMHVGMPKCGSSALQTFLSSKAGNQHKNKYIYVAIQKGGEVVCGDALCKHAEISPYNYISSHGHDLINNFSEEENESVTKELNLLSKKYEYVIISNEGWGPHAEYFEEEHPIFSKLLSPVIVYAFVRPQVEWLNSAWWQWGAWSDAGFGPWIRANMKNCMWGSILRDWDAKKWVTQTVAEPLSGDIVSTFLSYLSIENVHFPTLEMSKNQSLPGDVLRFFQKYRQLRPSPHSSAIEFILSKHIQLEKGKTPWVIGHTLAENIIQRNKNSNKVLFEKFLSKGAKDLFESDPKWSDVSFYKKKVVESPNPVDLPYESIEAMLLLSMQAIVNLDNDIRVLRR